MRVISDVRPPTIDSLRSGSNTLCQEFPQSTAGSKVWITHSCQDFCKVYEEVMGASLDEFSDPSPSLLSKTERATQESHP